MTDTTARRALKRGGVVSAGALLAVVGGSSLALGGVHQGVVPDPVSSTINSLPLPSPQPLPNASPTPLPEPVGSAVKTVTDALGGSGEAPRPPATKPGNTKPASNDHGTRTTGGTTAGKKQAGSTARATAAANHLNAGVGWTGQTPRLAA